MPTVYVTRRLTFNAAHRLHNPGQTDAWNEAVFGKCNSPNWHGHNYTLEVTVAGEPDPETGYVVDLGRVREVVEERVIRHVDHRNLNLDVDFLAGILPSSENLCIAFWQRIDGHLPAGKLYRVRLFETERNYAEYFGT